MPLPRVQTSVTLFGSPPWGFRVSGGKEFNQPLVVTRVTPGSLAAKSGVQSGDVLIAIANQYVSNLSQDECEAKVRQAIGSLHLVLEKNAAKVTELPGGQVEVDGDRSVYTATKDTQQRISKYNRSAKPFGAATAPTTSIQDKEPSESKAGFRPISFKPMPPSTVEPLPNSVRGEPDGVNSATDDMAKVTVEEPVESPYKLSKFNRKPAPFGASNTSNNSNIVVEINDLPPPPPDFLMTQNDSGGPTAIASKKVIKSANTPIGLYSKANASESYQAQVEDL